MAGECIDTMTTLRNLHTQIHAYMFENSDVIRLTVFISRYGWLIVLASFLNHVLVDGISFTFGVFYIEFLDEFQASTSKTSLVGSLLVGTYLMTGKDVAAYDLPLHAGA